MKSVRPLKIYKSNQSFQFIFKLNDCPIGCEPYGSSIVGSWPMVEVGGQNNVVGVGAYIRVYSLDTYQVIQSAKASQTEVLLKVHFKSPTLDVTPKVGR